MHTTARPSRAFSAVLCAASAHMSGSAARHQAAWIAGDEQAVEFIAPSLLTMETTDELLQRCAGHDLLVLDGGADARALVRRVQTPVLLARWCPGIGKITDAILLAVDRHGGAARAAEIAGMLARREGAAVSLMALPDDSRATTRALSTAGRIVLGATGSAPRIVGEPAPPWLEIPRAAAASGASLVVLGVSDADVHREFAYDVARHTGCSVLIAPALLPSERAGSVDETDRGLTIRGRRHGRIATSDGRPRGSLARMAAVSGRHDHGGDTP